MRFDLSSELTKNYYIPTLTMTLKKFINHSFKVFLLLLLTSFAGCQSEQVEMRVNEPDRERLKVLFLGDDRGHQPIERLRDVGTTMLNRGIELVYTDDLNDLDIEILSRYDALLLYANHEEITPVQEEHLLDYVERGGGFVPIHSASANFTNSEKFIELVGGQFQSHGAEVFSTEIIEPDHEIRAGF